jgi:uncharacterized protein YceK
MLYAIKPPNRQGDNMKKLLLAIPLLTLLLGCGNVNKMTAGWTGYTEVTVDGVVYLQFPSGVTVKYNKDGTVVTSN